MLESLLWQSPLVVNLYILIRFKTHECVMRNGSTTVLSPLPVAKQVKDLQVNVKMWKQCESAGEPSSWGGGGDEPL